MDFYTFFSFLSQLSLHFSHSCFCTLWPIPNLWVFTPELFWIWMSPFAFYKEKPKMINRSLKSLLEVSEGQENLSIAGE